MVYVATDRNASSPYQSFLMGSDVSGYVDASISYRTLFDYGDDANADVLAGRVNDYYLGLIIPSWMRLSLGL